MNAILGKAKVFTNSLITGNSTVIGPGYNVRGEIGPSLKIVLNSDERIIGGNFGLGNGIGPNLTFLSKEQDMEVSFNQCFTEEGFRFWTFPFTFSINPLSLSYS